MTDISKSLLDGDHAGLISALVRTARGAQAVLALSSHEARCNALRQAAAMIRDRQDQILERNAADVARAESNGISAAFIDRLTLNPARIDGMARGWRTLPALKIRSVVSWRAGRARTDLISRVSPPRSGSSG